MPKTLKVLTYNIRHGLGMDNAVNLARIAWIIYVSGADICGLQEVDKYNPRSKMLYQAKVLAKLTKMHFAFGANTRLIGPAQYGNAVLCKFPIIDRHNYLLPGGGEKRGLLKTIIDFQGEKINFFNTHLGLSQQDRIKQVQYIKHILSETAGRIIITGDLNEQPAGPAVNLLLEDNNLQNCASAEVPELTFPSQQPQKKIDYIIVSCDFEVINNRVISSLTSDHLPYFCTIKSHPDTD